MRDVRFRGKRVDNSKWIYGYYVFAHHYHYIIESEYVLVLKENLSAYSFEVIPKTVGQYTGLKDKNGKEIYEGDIIHDGLRVYTVEFYKGGFWLNQGQKGADWQIHNISAQSEIIGNIHENQELL